MFSLDVETATKTPLKNKPRRAEKGYKIQNSCTKLRRSTGKDK